MPLFKYIMNIKKNIIIALILTTLGGCVTIKHSKNGLPMWDYRRDEIIYDKASDVTKGGIYTSDEMLQDGIELKPNELAGIISKILLPMPQVMHSDAKDSASSHPLQSNSKWTISDSNKGQFTTDWRHIQGRKAGVLWWEKIYETEVRHMITIKQPYSTPNVSSFSIATEVHERPNASYPWAKADVELGRTSFEEIKNFLLFKINAEIKQRKSKR